LQTGCAVGAPVTLQQPDGKAAAPAAPGSGQGSSKLSLQAAASDRRSPGYGSLAPRSRGPGRAGAVPDCLTRPPGGPPARDDIVAVHAASMLGSRVILIALELGAGNMRGNLRFIR
jgi:hypothetical protein